MRSAAIDCQTVDIMVYIAFRMIFYEKQSKLKQNETGKSSMDFLRGLKIWGNVKIRLIDRFINE